MAAARQPARVSVPGPNVTGCVAGHLSHPRSALPKKLIVHTHFPSTSTNLFSQVQLLGSVLPVDTVVPIFPSEHVVHVSKENIDLNVFKPQGWHVLVSSSNPKPGGHTHFLSPLSVTNKTNEGSQIQLSTVGKEGKTNSSRERLVLLKSGHDFKQPWP